MMIMSLKWSHFVCRKAAKGREITESSVPLDMIQQLSMTKVLAKQSNANHKHKHEHKKKLRNCSLALFLVLIMVSD